MFVVCSVLALIVGRRRRRQLLVEAERTRQEDGTQFKLQTIDTAVDSEIEPIEQPTDAITGRYEHTIYH